MSCAKKAAAAPTHPDLTQNLGYVTRGRCSCCSVSPASQPQVTTSARRALVIVSDILYLAIFSGHLPDLVNQILSPAFTQARESSSTCPGSTRVQKKQHLGNAISEKSGRCCSGWCCSKNFVGKIPKPKNQKKTTGRPQSRWPPSGFHGIQLHRTGHHR